MATVDTTITVYVHARRFRVFLWIVETLTLCGVIQTATAIQIVERWALPVLAPFVKRHRRKVRLWT